MTEREVEMSRVVIIMGSKSDLEWSAENMN